MNIKIKPNPLPPFRKLYDLPKGTWMVINIGARGGGKSYEVSKFGVIQATVNNKRIAVLRDEKTNISESIMNEFKNRFEEIDEKSNGYFSSRFDMQSNHLKDKKTNSTLIFTKGFKTSSNQKTATLKSISDVDIAIIEEFEDVTDELKFNTFSDSIRNEGSYILINTNIPDKNHWFVKRYFDLKETQYEGYYELIAKQIEGVVYIFSDYKTNPHLQPHTVAKYEAYGNPQSPFYDLHYYLTQIVGYCSAGRIGQVYKNWKRITNEDFNNLPYRSIFGLDFGWNKSPMAMVECKFHNQNMFVRELMYLKNITPLELAVELCKLGITEKDIIVADCAEPQTISKLMQGYSHGEIDNLILEKYPQLKKGFFVLTSNKDIELGISRVKEHIVSVTDTSINLWNEEYPNYSYAVDKNGNPTDTTDEGHDHLMDAIRYVVMAKNLHF